MQGPPRPPEFFVVYVVVRVSLLFLLLPSPYARTFHQVQIAKVERRLVRPLVADCQLLGVRWLLEDYCLSLCSICY